MQPLQPPHTLDATRQLGGAQASGTVFLPASLDLIGADALLVRLQETLAQLGMLVVDGSDVERVSTAGIQVLVAARMHALAENAAFRLHSVSAVLQDALFDLGLLGALGLEAG